jgi:hypothetical protein
MFLFAVTPILILIEYKRCMYNQNRSPRVDDVKGWQQMLPKILNYSWIPRIISGKVGRF